MLTTARTITPTNYAGTTFRSRLEATWAEWFDGIGLRWEYEAHRVTTPIGAYVPDFTLGHTPEAWEWLVEIKPEGYEPTPRDYFRWGWAESAHPDLIVTTLYGPPSPTQLQRLQDAKDRLRVQAAITSGTFTEEYQMASAVLKEATARFTRERRPDPAPTKTAPVHHRPPEGG